jgi:hypothetical protein
VRSYVGCSKLLLFKSFTTGLSVQEFDDIYYKDMTKEMTIMRHNDYHPPKAKIQKEKEK